MDLGLIPGKITSRGSNSMKQKHHLLPRYRGGSNDPGNLVEVTTTQHAMFHYCNWRLWGSEEDRIAWRCLSGQISIDDAILESRRLGGRNCHLNNPDHLKYLNRSGNYHDKMWRGTPPEKRKEIGQKIQEAKGTRITCFCENTGETKTFPSLQEARKFYNFGMGTIRKLYSGEMPSYKGVRVIP